MKLLLYIEKYFFRPFILPLLPVQLSTYIYGVGRKYFFHYLKNRKVKPVTVNTQPIEAFGLRFRNSLGNAAGFDKDGELLKFNYNIGAGYAVVGTVLNQKYGGLIQRFLGREYHAWLPFPKSKSSINSLGLPSAGIDKVVSNIMRFRETCHPKNFPIGISLASHPAHEDNVQLQGILDSIEKSIEAVDFFEINESCPNIAHKDDFQAFEHRVRRISQHVHKRKPLFFKFTHFGDAHRLLELLEQLQVDAITATNTHTHYEELLPKLHQSEKKMFKQYIRRYGGGVSGKPIEGEVRKKVSELASLISQKKMNLKIIHCGGIFFAEDVERAKEQTILQQWYTGSVEKITTEKAAHIYPSMF